MEQTKEATKNQQPTFKRIPAHIGIIPDGNRRWAIENNLEKQDGYDHGVAPGYRLYELLVKHGIKEATFYGFTKDNTNRPKIQTLAYTKACVDAVNAVANKDANILVIGNTDSKLFPDELRMYTEKRVNFGKGLIDLNFLVNYDWNWDLSPTPNETLDTNKKFSTQIKSHDISRIDLIIRWGGRRRLSGFLPVQSVYSDFFIVEDYWPAFNDNHVTNALNWYQECDVTLGG